MPEQSDHSAEAAFIRRLVRREESAFNELVQLYERRLFALVFRMLGNRHEAEEVTQEVFVQVFKSIEQFRGDSKLSTWLFRVAVNHCKNRIKYHQRRGGPARDYDALADGSAGSSARGVSVGTVERPDELVAGMQLEQIVRTAMSRVDPDFRSLVVLRDVEDLPYEDIAQITGLALGTVKSRIHRGREQLRVLVERMLGESIGKAKK